MIDVERYFARTGYRGPRTPTLATLNAIHGAHCDAIPFETLDPLLRRPVSLEPLALQAKLVDSRRGGYCFEQNSLLCMVLRALGFAVTILAARVLDGVPPERRPSPRTHMVLRVDIDGTPYLADVGFGGFLWGAALRIDSAAEQLTPGGTMRIARTVSGLGLHTRRAGDWRALYEFTLDPQHPIDMEVANWYTSTHPRSWIGTNLVVQRLCKSNRLTLINTRFERVAEGGIVEQSLLTSPGDLACVLTTEFGLDLPADEGTLFAAASNGVVGSAP